MSKPKITEEQFDSIERGVTWYVANQFREVTGQELPDAAKQKVADFINDLVADETVEAA